MILNLQVDIPQARESDDPEHIGKGIIELFNHMLRNADKPEIGKETFEATWE